ncbi:MAG: hypothetical protein LC541_10360 [Candidatus Thiodiazotropha sp.]|nr:hypothetical protein [Candidatus Thiodiazotropha sp.]MCM8883680.1 hypothetical protein [Candidatus Thiodiazotropha sp.]
MDADRQEFLLPPDIVKAKSAVQNSTKIVQAALNETLVMREGLNPTTPPLLSLGNLPLIVLAASKADEEVVINNTEIEKLESNLQKKLAISGFRNDIIFNYVQHSIAL